jgi:enterochelin esterase family protein
MFNRRFIASIAWFLGVVWGSGGTLAQPPIRAFDAPGAPEFKVLGPGRNPVLDEDGNFVIGPDYVTAPESKEVDGVPKGKGLVGGIYG